MDIPEIAILETEIEMRREVLRLAIEKKCTEDEIWDELNLYRKTQERKGKKPVRAGLILKNILDNISGVKITESPIEDALKYELDQRRIQYQTQQRIGRYRVDFLFEEAKLIIECDGKYHRTGKQLQKDRDRDLYLIGKGYTVQRFSGDQLYRDVERCVNIIESFLPAKEKGGINVQ